MLVCVFSVYACLSVSLCIHVSIPDFWGLCILCALSLCVSGCWSSDFDCPLSLFPPLPSLYTPAVTPCSYNHVNGTLDEDEKIEPTPIIIFEVCVRGREGGGERDSMLHNEVPCGECVYTHVTCGERVYVRSFVRVCSLRFIFFYVHGRCVFCFNYLLRHSVFCLTNYLLRHSLCYPPLSTLPSTLAYVYIPVLIHCSWA